MKIKLPENRFEVTKEELAKLGEEFNSEAFPLLNELYKTSFCILLDKKPAKKIIRQTYSETIEDCNVTKSGADWWSWMHRIWMREIREYYSAIENDINTKFDFIDFTKTDLNEVKNFFRDDSSEQRISQKDFISNLKRLPSVLRIPLIMKEVHSLSYEKIAELIDVPDGVIATRIFRARKLLFIFLRGNYDYEKQKRSGLPENFIPIIFEYRKSALLVDNELNAEKLREFNEILKTQKEYEAELLIQKEIKNLFKKLIPDIKAPDGLRSKIEKMAFKKFKKTQ
ncbi:MAG: sigma factor-like helix-turn-helix DNA-binding protein [Ignavibacteriaceae bacterium]